MHTYRYKAINASGKMHIGQVEAVNEADLEMRLHKMGLDLINYWATKNKDKRILGRGIKRRNLITFCFHIEQTMQAGIPILDGLQDLRDSADDRRLVEVVTALIESVEGGKMLSESMQDFPIIFSKVFISLVSAGEKSGEMGMVFRELGDNLKWQDEQIARTRKILIYPIFVSLVLFAVIFFLMIYVVPELLMFIKVMGEELPLHTQVLIAISNVFVGHWPIILALPFVLVLGLYIGLKVNPSLSLKYDRMKLSFPILGPILKKVILARVANFFALMYASGITITECIQASGDIANNQEVASAMEQVGQQILDGATLSKSFQSVDLFPPLVLRMIRIGESTGALEDALKNISYFYTRDIKESIEHLQAIIGPAMTLILGGIIAWVIFSVLGPIYDLITQVNI